MPDDVRTIQLVDTGSLVAGTWSPTIRDEASALLESLVPAGARPRVENETFAILSRCLPPTDEAGRRTGLVVGQVQSGKTLSFTAVAWLSPPRVPRSVTFTDGEVAVAPPAAKTSDTRNAAKSAAVTRP